MSEYPDWPLMCVGVGLDFQFLGSCYCVAAYFLGCCELSNCASIWGVIRLSPPMMKTWERWPKHPRLLYSLTSSALLRNGQRYQVEVQRGMSCSQSPWDLRDFHHYFCCRLEHCILQIEPCWRYLLSLTVWSGSNLCPDVFALFLRTFSLCTFTWSP